MGMEAGETGNVASMEGEVRKLNIKFGSHGADESNSGGEMKKLSESNFPKDVADEWPETKQIHSFHIVKYRAYEIPNLKAKLDLAEKEIQKKNQSRLEILKKLKNIKADRAQIRTEIHSLSLENKQFKTILDEKKKEMEPLQQALSKLRGGRERGSGICSSEEELNDLIKSFQYRIQHESIPLSEEKQILREIKQLEGTRELVIAKAAERAKIQDSLGEKDVIQDQVKLIGFDLDGVRKEKQVLFEKIKQLDEGKLAAEKEISSLEEELKAVTEKLDKLRDDANEMRKKQEDVNSPFYQNRSLMAKAKVLASKKDIEAVKELSNSEVEKFISLWISDKAFRDDYEKRILPSLDMRFLSRDGRIRDPDEKPLVEKPTPSEPQIAKTVTKISPKEDIISTAPKAKNAKNKNDVNKKTEMHTVEKIEVEDKEETTDKIQKGSLPKKEEKVDEKKLKELKRQEEMAKRKLAEERKKKLAEKAAAKAAVIAQKEAEKKLKEREKRARKKSGAAVAAPDPEEQSEHVSEVAEQPEKVEEKIETQSVPQKTKKENSVRLRTRTRGPDSLPKALLKRKKGTNYWVWGAFAGALVVVLLVLLGYSYYN